jgi:hypothetical protein
MSKRFTETAIWDDAWFQALPLKYKLLWKYICDKCRLSGAWPTNLSLAEFQIGDRLDPSEALAGFNNGKERVKVCNGVWLILDFVSFQYGQLHPDKVRFHKTIQIELDRLCHRLSDTRQEGEKEKEGEGDMVGERENSGDGGYTLEDCQTASEGIGLAPQDIESFFTHYAAVDFIDGAGRRITSLKHALAKWKAKKPEIEKKAGKEYQGRV